MTIKRRFPLLLPCFLLLFASGALAPNAVASPWPEGFGDTFAPVEQASPPPLLEDSVRTELISEQGVDAVGSVAEQEAASETEPAGVDLGTDASDESSRAAVTPPAYPLTVNPQVQYFLDRFTGARRDIVTLWVGRSGRYLGMIREVLRNRGLPEELAYTAMIESGFNPVAVSRMGAKGLWQFMAATARRYGLRVDQWIDERLDPEKSTVAAAAYLRDLYTMFGSWALAKAAYNAGEVKVSRAIKATGSSDFWALAKTNHLKRETKDFVPAIHAATLIAKDPARYGFEFEESGPVAVETVAVPPSTDLRPLAARTGIRVETLRALNPVLVRGVTPPGGAWQLRVPPGTGGDVLAALAPPARPRLATAVARNATRRTASTEQVHDVHIVRPKDTVSSIAKQYGVAVKDLLRWNRLEGQARIRPGDRIKVAEVRPAVERDGQGGFR